MKRNNRCFRIFTEDVNRSIIERIVSQSFKGFTEFSADGFWQGSKEHSLVIEILGSDSLKSKIRKVAREIKAVNHQQAVLVQELSNSNYLL